MRDIVIYICGLDLWCERACVCVYVWFESEQVMRANLFQVFDSHLEQAILGTKTLQIVTISTLKHKNNIQDKSHR